MEKKESAPSSVVADENAKAARPRVGDHSIIRHRGWRAVQENLPRIVEYGRTAGMVSVSGPTYTSPAAVDDTQDGDGSNENQTVEKLNLPTSDISWMHEAIPYLPLPVALLCFALNFSIPGAGTVFSGIVGMCLGQPRVSAKHEGRLLALIVNGIVGFSQFITVPFFLVGWFWSLAWGFQFIIHSTAVVPYGMLITFAPTCEIDYLFFKVLLYNAEKLHIYQGELLHDTAKLEQRTYDVWDYTQNFFFGCVMAFFAIWAILATITDYIVDTYYKDRVYGTGMKVFLTYSIYTNGAELMNVSPYKKGTIKSLASIRFISMTWVVAGHVLLDVLVSDTLKPVMEIWNPFLSTTIMNAFLSVDTFFFLSGILVSYLFFKVRPSAAFVRNPMVWVMYYVHRYFRLTPAIMIFIWLFVTIAPLINGPWAQTAVGTQTSDYKPCEKYWWRNLLYINNFFDMGQNCYGITWYLAVDMQLYVVAPVFLIVFYISWIAGYALVCLCIAGSIAYVYYVTIQHDIPAIMVGAFALNDVTNFGLKLTDFFELYYQRPWSRCTPYLIGIAVGYFLASGKKPKLNKMLIVSLWVLAAALALASLYAPHRYLKGEDYWSNVVSGIYNNFSRFAWSLAIAWVVVANHLGWGGIIAEFMDHPLWQPLGKLSYCSFIVHYFLISYIHNLDDRPSHFVSIWRAYIHMGIPTVVVSYVFAFFWSCLFEVPVTKLEKMLTANLMPKKKSAIPKQFVQESTKGDINGVKNNVL